MCCLCHKPYKNRYRYWYRDAHVKCTNELKKEQEQVKEETDIQESLHRWHLREFQLQLLLMGGNVKKKE